MRLSSKLGGAHIVVCRFAEKLVRDLDKLLSSAAISARTFSTCFRYFLSSAAFFFLSRYSSFAEEMLSFAAADTSRRFAAAARFFCSYSLYVPRKSTAPSGDIVMILVASLSIKYLSWLTAISVPSYPASVLERLARRYVEVVCRLVEDQKIHLSEHQLRKGETRASPPESDGYAFRHILRAEKKLCEHAVYRAPPSWGMRPTARREPFSCR